MANPTPPPIDELAEEAQREAALTAALEAQIAAQRHDPAAEVVAAEQIMDGVDGLVRKRWGPWPWVQRTALGLVQSVDIAKHRTRTSVAPAGVGAASAQTVKFGFGTPQVGKRYPVEFPVRLPDAPTRLITGPVPAGDPWLKAPGGQKLFYAVGTLNPFPPHWPKGPTVGVAAIDWPLPTDPATLPGDLSATDAGSFNFTAQSQGSRDFAAARFIGVDGLGTVWAILTTIRPVPDTFQTLHGDGSIEVGATVQQPVVSYLRSIPAQGAGNPDGLQTCPDFVVPLAVDATPGHSGLLSVDEPIWTVRDRSSLVKHIVPPAADTHYTWMAIGNNHALDHYVLRVGTVDAGTRTVGWSTAATVTGEGEWIVYTIDYERHIHSDPSTHVLTERVTNDTNWRETFHERIAQGHLDGWIQQSYFAYAYPAAELANTIWTDAQGHQHWRAAFQTYPDPLLKDGPLYRFNADAMLFVGDTLTIPSTDGPRVYGGFDPQPVGFPIHQEELDVGRYATYIGDGGLVRTWAIPGLPYGMWGAGPTADGGEWAIVTRIPDRLMTTTHDQDTLLAVLVTHHATQGLGGDTQPFPAHGEFTIGRIVARSPDGTQVLAEDTNGTYNADEQSMSPGRLWQTTDGGATWTRLAFRITALPAPSGQQAQGYGFIVEAA